MSLNLNNIRIPVINLIGLLLLISSNQLYAIGLNAEITLSEPDGEYFEPDNELIVTLRLTDNDDNPLRVDQYRDNGLRFITIWVSGPRQNYLSVEPYTPVVILNQQIGFNQNSGFDPQSGEIEITLPPDIDDYGTYSILFNCERYTNNRWYTCMPITDFQVGQAQPTVTASNTYLTCGSQMCHLNPSQHGINDITTCVLCHTHNYDTPWHRIEHDRQAHQNHMVETCHECHRSNAGIDRIGLIACLSCHEPCDNIPDDVEGEGCLECHDGETDWIYEGHNEFIPQPPNAFDLLQPDNNSVLESPSVSLSWEDADDNDNDDIVSYSVELSLDSEFENVRYFNYLNRNRLSVNDLVEDAYYWWRVKAVDLNTDGTYSSETWRFQTAEPQPLTPFDLVEPGNGDTLRVPAFFRLDLVWQTSVDPDLEYQALYSLFMEIQVTCGIDTFIYYEGLVDTMSAINLSDTLNLNRWDRAIDVLWWIEACSGGETIECENAFEFSIVPYNRVTDTKSPIPEDFSISQAYPNPFNSTTNIRFGLPKNELVLVKIIDLTGNVVETLIDGRLPAGYHTVSWNSLDYPAGVYICNLQAGGFSEAVKMVLVK